MELYIFTESTIEIDPKQHLKEQINDFMILNNENVIKTTEFPLNGKICILVWLKKG